MLSISAVIPTYNRDRYLAEAVQSVITQTSPPLEIIVVDDGSTDRTEHVVREFRSPIPISFVRQTNQGVAVARNRGVKMARGSWIAFLDSDDLWNPSKLAIQIAHVNQHPDTAFVYTDKELIDELGRPIAQNSTRSDLMELIFGRCPFALPSTILVKKEALLKVGGFNPLLRAGEDLELCARLVPHVALAFIPLALIKYRVHSKNLSRTVAPHSWPPLMLDRIEELWRDDPAKQAVLMPYLTQSYAHRSKELLQSGRYREARHYARLALARRWSLKHVRRLVSAYCPILGAWHYRQRKLQ